MRKYIKSLVVISFLCLGCFSGCENADDVNNTIADPPVTEEVGKTISSGNETGVGDDNTTSIEDSATTENSNDNGGSYTPYNKEEYRTNVDTYGMDEGLAKKLDEWDKKADERDAYYERDYKSKLSKYSNW